MVRSAVRSVRFVVFVGLTGALLAGCARTPPAAAAPDYAPPPVYRPDAKGDLEGGRTFRSDGPRRF